MAGGLNPDGEREEQMDDAELSGKVVGAQGRGLGNGQVRAQAGSVRRANSGVRRDVCTGDGDLGGTRPRRSLSWAGAMEQKGGGSPDPVCLYP